MMLVGANAVDLEDPLSKWRPSLPAWATRMKVRHLLDYTSGLPEPHIEMSSTLDSLIADLHQIEALEHEPGEGYIYSNNNVLLRFLVIEAVTGMPYREFLAQRILAPCRMTSTRLWGPRTSRPRSTMRGPMTLRCRSFPGRHSSPPSTSIVGPAASTTTRSSPHQHVCSSQPPLAMGIQTVPMPTTAWEKLTAGATSQAVESYRRSLELDPNNENARQVIERLQP